MRSFLRIAAIFGAAVTALTLATPASASLTLTAAATSNGFTLTTFADFSTITGGGCCNGPFGLAVTGSGNVLSSVNGVRYVFNNVDGQAPGSEISSVASTSGTQAYARAGGLAYGGNGPNFVQFNDNGTINHVLTGVPSPFLGMWGAPNGHIIATSAAGLIDIDPLDAGGTGSFRVINVGGNGDGVTVSPDGLTAYVEQSGGIRAYDIATGAPGVFISVPGFSADGTGVITGGIFDGDLIINNNNGDVDLWHFATSTMMTVATGSSPFGADRGDYVASDAKGCLFLDEGNHIDRLCLAGASIGGGGTLPEPASIVLTATALIGLGVARRRRV